MLQLIKISLLNTLHYNLRAKVSISNTQIPKASILIRASKPQIYLNLGLEALTSINTAVRLNNLDLKFIRVEFLKLKLRICSYDGNYLVQYHI